MNKKILIISGIILFLDQVVKTVVETFIKLNSSIVVFKNFFSITYTNNYGAAWSILNNQQWLLIIITFIALGIIYRYMNTFKDNTRNKIAFALLFGGIAGNLLDRLFLGYVRDFIAFKIFGYNAPIFNISDMAIFFGVMLLIIAIFKGEDNGSSSNRKPNKGR